MVWQYQMDMTSLYILICEIMFACVHMLKQFVLSPIPCAAMASSLMARIVNDVHCPLALFCFGSAPVGCHPATGTPQWGSAEVFFCLIVLLVCFLFSLLVLFVLLALSALPCLPIVCTKPEIKHKVEPDTLELSNSCFDALICLMLAHVMSAVACDI